MAAKQALKRAGLMVILAGLFLAVILYARPLPAVYPKSSNLIVPPSQASALPWPVYGQTALGALGFGLLDSHGPQTPAPIASISKVITALTVLEKYPLKAGEQGPMITISDKDVALYQDYLNQGGSVVKVSSGEQISEYQALQALLLPSANNIADTLAIWAYGSMEEYLISANREVKSLGMESTAVADASGLIDKTTSTASDLVLLGQAALAQPVLAAIVAQSQAEIPVAGRVINTNWLLGNLGVQGIKTGNTDKAGGCYLFAAKRQAAGKDILVIGAILGAPTLSAAITDSKSLITAAGNNFELITPVKAGKLVTSYKLPWGGVVNAVAKQDVSLVAWRPDKVQLVKSLEPLNTPEVKDAKVGSIKVSAGSQSNNVSVVLNQNAPGPSWYWRVFR